MVGLSAGPLRGFPLGPEGPYIIPVLSEGGGPPAPRGPPQRGLLRRGSPSDVSESVLGAYDYMGLSDTRARVDGCALAV